MVVHKEVIWQGVWMWAGKVLKECLELCKNGIDNGMLLSTSKQWLEGFDMNSSADQAMIAGNWQGLWGWPDNDCRELTGYVGLIRQWLQGIDRDSGAEKAMIARNWQGLWGWPGNYWWGLTESLNIGWRPWALPGPECICEFLISDYLFRFTFRNHNTQTLWYKTLTRDILDLHHVGIPSPEPDLEWYALFPVAMCAECKFGYSLPLLVKLIEQSLDLFWWSSSHPEASQVVSMQCMLLTTQGKQDYYRSKLVFRSIFE